MFSILRAVFHAITFKLTFPKKYRNKTVRMEDGLRFKIFRHMRLEKRIKDTRGAIFIARFKFKKFSHKVNMRASRIPIPMIAGFPGFRDKVWMIDWETDCWQGVYQFDSVGAIERYKRSFVLGVMNKRADPDTLSYEVIPDRNIDDYLESVIVG